MNITHIASPCYQDSYSQSYSATYSKDEVFTFTAATTDRPEYQPVAQLQKVMVNGKYTYEVPANITVKLGDDVICQAPNNRLWIGQVTSLKSEFTGNCKQIKLVVTNWSFSKKLLFRLREDLRQELSYLELTSTDVLHDITAYLDGMKNKISGYKLDEDIKFEMISYLTNYVKSYFAKKELVNGR